MFTLCESRSQHLDQWKLRNFFASDSSHCDRITPSLTLWTRPSSTQSATT
ncbi:Hypothetical protein FKW44_019781 [Caligus rogercresseyi]|uniref:Uncharacterized protein n=1 Tax=Caligus rogercresseyi TaxID=217165 RepID=A0A7T8GWB3_CALRO|nr:Hypothetical protein FKW44_019781 [Caligus rogercresseyi]